MIRVDELRQYPVAGMQGYPVEELIITPEAIVGNKSFAVVLKEDVSRYLEKRELLPARLPQTRFPKLVLFHTKEQNGTLVITYQDESLVVDQDIVVGETDRPFISDEDSFSDVAEVLSERALPFRASSTAKTPRWAIDCGDEAASWLSERLGAQVRLVKAVKHPETQKHHFTWNTDAHAIVAASVAALALEAGQEVDEDTLRYNIRLVSGEEPFDEEKWKKAIIAGTQAVIWACQRCGYIGIQQATATLAHYTKVIKAVNDSHGLNFGIYIKFNAAGNVVVRVGDELTVIEREE